MQHASPKLTSFGAFVNSHRRFFLAWTLAGLAFRLAFFFQFPALTNDSFVYGEIAKNWLQHGVFGQTYEHGPEPTFIRLPGYPIFLVLTWLVAGVEHYRAVLLVQIVVDVLTCFVIADLARRIASEQAAKWAFAIAALCPFFANYAAVVLTETWAIFFAALALDLAVFALDRPDRRALWAACGIALGCGILLRPDGGMLLMVIGGYALFVGAKRRGKQYLTAAALMGVIALFPLAPWTLRNWHTFRVFQPLAPFNANMPWEFVPRGFNRWVRTWSADYSSVEDVWFKADGEDITIGMLPQRAFDGESQRAQTQELLELYADNGDTFSPALDSKFDELAAERIRARPIRYYVTLPALRAADLWLRPRTEMLPIDPHWWRLREDDPSQFWWSVVLGVINLFYVIAAVVAIVRGRIRYAGIFLGFGLLRTAFVAWMPNPEPRYMLECYPALIAIAGAAFERLGAKSRLAANLAPKDLNG